MYVLGALFCTIINGFFFCIYCTWQVTDLELAHGKKLHMTFFKLLAIPGFIKKKPTCLRGTVNR